MVDLKFSEVSKRYRIHQQEDSNPSSPAWLRQLKRLCRPAREFWALREVSFAVERGEALGIIGHNGAGKSTILKLLSGITAPSAGEVTINGRLVALIEVGSGFHPELTGRENVYLNGSILGMRRREIAAKLDSIIDFAGVRSFIDMPVKRYSSGMYVRLGFSIAAHLDPDILLLDEVLAVGDATFQEKCVERLRELERAGKTIIFISHDMSAVEQLCDRVLLLQQGRVVADGAPREVIAQYRHSAAEFISNTRLSDVGMPMTKQAEVTSLRFYDDAGRETITFTTGAPLIARIECHASAPIPDAVLGVFFYTHKDEMICHFSSLEQGTDVALPAGRSVYEFHCPALGLQPGTYHVDVAIERRDSTELVDWQYHCALLMVADGKPVRGNVYIPHRFQALPAVHSAEQTMAGEFV